MLIRCFFPLLVFFVLATTALSEDWPQWLGPRRDSVWREKGVVERFPEKGLKINWRVPVQLGYSGPAVASGRVFVTDYVKESGEITNNPGGRDRLEGRERVLCFDARSGELLWKHEYECAYNLSYPAGPRCTPTVDANRVYTLGAEGTLLCLNVEKGTVIWDKDFHRDYGAETPIWGFAAHPLIDGELLYCVVGGAGSVAVAFDKMSGKEVWRSLSAADAGYCPPTMIQHNGKKQLLIWHPDALNSLDPRSGDVYWSERLKPNYRMSITAPRKLGDLLFASGIGDEGALFKLGERNSRPSVEVIWRGKSKRAVYSGNSTPFLEDGMIYGADCQLGALIGARLEDGQRLWETFEPTSGGERRASHGTAFLVKHEDRFLLFSETGDLIMAKLSPAGYQELSRFHVVDPTNECFGRDVVWTHPAFAYRCAFVRNDKELVCVSLSAE